MSVQDQHQQQAYDDHYDDRSGRHPSYTSQDNYYQSNYSTAPATQQQYTASNGPTNEGHQATGDYQRQTRQSIVSDHYEQTYDQVSAQIESAQQLVEERKYSGRPSPERPYPRRPKNRNSNILSAVLCLIKELDGPSLEVAEMAVRCRMEELED